MNCTVVLSTVAETWLASLQKKDAVSYRRIVARIARMEVGNFGDSKAVGDKVFELRLDFGPGYRVYFTQRGLELIVVLGGGDKKTQDADIEAAKVAVRSLA